MAKLQEFVQKQIKLNPDDFSEEMDQTILIRKRVRGSKLEGLHSNSFRPKKTKKVWMTSAFIHSNDRSKNNKPEVRNNQKIVRHHLSSSYYLVFSVDANCEFVLR